MTRILTGAVALPFALAIAGCNVEPATTTGGVDLPARGACPRGIAVVSSDYLSTEVALLGPNGSVESAAFLSSSSTEASGLAAPLSGDVTVAAAPLTPSELVLVDRFGTNVLTFIDVKTQQVRAQLAVGTGFEANAQTYVQASEARAYVPRLRENAAPGRQAFDAGSDLLVIDPRVPQIVGSIAMPRRQGYLPNPTAVALLGSDVVVTLLHALPSYRGMGDGELAAFSLDDESLRFRHELSGLQNCGRVEASPSGELWAVACAGYLDPRGVVPAPEKSGLVLLRRSGDALEEVSRFAALDIAGAPIQATIAFATEKVLLVKTQTPIDANADNQLLAFDLDRGRGRVLETAARGPAGLGYGVAFGGMHCSTGCGDPCLVTDASRSALLRFEIASGELAKPQQLFLGASGLPPTGVTPFW